MAEKIKEINVVTTEESHAIWDVPKSLIRNNLYCKSIVLPDDIFNYKTFREILTMIVSKRCPTLQNLIVKDMGDAIKDAVTKGQLELNYLHDWNKRCPECNSSNINISGTEETLVDDSNVHFWKCGACGYKFKTCSVYILVVKGVNMKNHDGEYMGKREVANYLWGIKTTEEVDELSDILSRRSGQLEEQIILNFKVGDRVYFNGSRNAVEHGTVTKLTKRRVHVKTSDSEWQVPPSSVHKENQKQEEQT